MRFTGGWQRAVLGAAVSLLLGAWAFGQEPGKAGAKGKAKDKDQKAARREFDKQVNEAIDKGIKYLRKAQGGDRNWGGSMGVTALAAMALLEAGIPQNDKAIQAAAAYVRQKAIRESNQYSVAVAIMFLDRLGDPQDEPFIEALGVRLLAGQIRKGTGQAGGWSYYTPLPQPAEVSRLTDCLKKRKELPAGADPAKGQEKQRPRTPKDLPKELLEEIAKIYKEGPGDTVPAMPGNNSADNSNTQFALLALWAARRHGVPVERAFALAEQRLRSTQHAGGGWAYKYYPPEMRLPPSDETSATPQMTCCGLIGLALAHGAAAAKRDMSKDMALAKGLQAIAAVVGHPFTDPKKIPRIPPGENNKLYYTLWTLERMAVLYDFPTIAGKDWYKWGAQLLLANQQKDGSWAGAYPGVPDTCFALLFLKRANIAADLTERIKKDPNRPKLLEPIQEPAGKGNAPPPGKKSSLSPQPNSTGTRLATRLRRLEKMAYRRVHRLPERDIVAQNLRPFPS